MKAPSKKGLTSKGYLQRQHDQTIQVDAAICGTTLFDIHLPKLMRPEQLAEYFGYSTATIYDWKYRGRLRGVPKGLFLSLNRRLYVRTDLFLTWIASQNPELELGCK